ncbi:hypothetical protein OAU50_04845 [Planctomycetota bacterium]|nr:hypothetical protein [Planctomycetota bacterium]
MGDTPVLEWFIGIRRDEARGALIHAFVLFICFPIAVFITLGALMGVGFFFYGYMPIVYWGAFALIFITYPFVRHRLAPDRMKTASDTILSAILVSPHLLWLCVLEVMRSFHIRKIDTEPYIPLLRQAWGSEKRISTEALSFDPDEAHKMALELSHFPGIFYTPEEYVVELSEKSISQINRIAGDE